MPTAHDTLSGREDEPAFPELDGPATVYLPAGGPSLWKDSGAQHSGEERENEEVADCGGFYSLKFLRRYILYAKNRIEPELSEAASEYIALQYTNLRNKVSSVNVLPPFLLSIFFFLPASSLLCVLTELPEGGCTHSTRNGTDTGDTDSFGHRSCSLSAEFHCH